jgi:ABC-type antimicrobial peptide transport system permease subunit
LKRCKYVRQSAATFQVTKNATALSSARRQELAVRLAIGAGGDRLVRQLFTECLVLATMGGTLGLGLAAASRPLMLLMVPASLPTGALPTLD